MARTASRWRLAGWLVLAAALATGCNIPSLLYFLYPGGDLRDPPELATLAPVEKGKPVKVAVIAYSSLPLSPEFVTADRDLAAQLSQQIFQSFKENKQERPSRLELPGAQGNGQALQGRLLDLSGNRFDEPLRNRQPKDALLWQDQHHRQRAERQQAG